MGPLSRFAYNMNENDPVEGEPDAKEGMGRATSVMAQVRGEKGLNSWFMDKKRQEGRVHGGGGFGGGSPGRSSLDCFTFPERQEARSYLRARVSEDLLGISRQERKT